MTDNTGSESHKSYWLNVFFGRGVLFTLVFVSATTAHPGYGRSVKSSTPGLTQQNGLNKQVPESKVRSYIDDPSVELTRSIPELKTLHPATDQRELPMILEKTGERVDEFFDKRTDLVAKEIVSEERVDPITGGPFKYPPGDRIGVPANTFPPNQFHILQDQYNYFIVRKGNLAQTLIREYRRDAQGNEVGPGVKFLSAGFASSILYFSKSLQTESRFRYLGEEQVGTRDAYVVAFAQIPEIASVSITMRQPDGVELHWLIQGIAWVDKFNFHILQMKTELFVPQTLPVECNQRDQLQVLVKFSEVQPNGLANSMWLPTEASVHEVVDGYSDTPKLDCKNGLTGEFRNVHEFTDYRRYIGADDVTASLKESEPKDLSTEANVQKNEAQAHPYLEEPLQHLVKHISELKGIRPGTTQQDLAMILRKTGERVDEFFDNLVDLIANEEIKQERLGTFGVARGSESVRENYLVLRRGNGARVDFDEFRMDEKGNRLAQVGQTSGFLVTSGFALVGVHFSTGFQRDSRFRYLGDQKIGSRDTYAIAFAQVPTYATLNVTLEGPRGTAVHMLTQGIVWVDKENFHILRMRTDLLARQPEIGLDEQTTEVKFSEVRLQDVATPLWLPRDVRVYIKFGKSLDMPFEEVFRNTHHYTNYRRYRVSTKMVAPK